RYHLMLPPLIAAEASYFVLIQSNQRSSQQKCFFAHGPFTHKASKAARAGIFLRGPPCRSLTLYRKKFLCPNPAHRPSAFCAFARSLSADGLRISYCIREK